jgi:hypothetical protein
MRHLGAAARQPRHRVPRGRRRHRRPRAGGPARGASKGSACAPAPATRPGARLAGQGEYRSRLEDLRAEIEEAESFNDPERAPGRARRWTSSRTSCRPPSGLGGRDRRAASAAERARVNVTRALRREIRRIADEDAGLGRELETTVRTGTFCAYEPDPRRPVAWEVDAG